MNVMLILLVAIALMMVSGVPGTLFSARSAGGQKLATALLSLGALLGLACVALARAGGAEVSLDLAWGVPGSRFAVALDAVGAVFLLPVFVVPALGSVYGHGYWRQSEHPANGRRLTLAYGVLAGAMALVVLARDGLLFLIAWEVMALAAYFAATAEDDKPEVRRAGWIYLVATHVGTLCLFAMFSLWRASTGSLGLASATALPAATASALFLLALVGFGFKAGLMPLHVWLPGAHANAPSHVSAVMSGVMLKMGVYGLVRMTLLLPAGPSWWGYTVLAMGAVSSVAGIAFAIGQRDLKRLLAYSSIENIGIVAMGLGLALLGRTEGRPVWVLLGLSGALLHVWNHSLFKSLLFLNAGAVIHAVETREIDRMGGLAKRMPKAAALFAVGAAAICALPPLNGFAGEWLLYNGLFTALGLGPGPSLPAAAVAVAALAMTGALAVACFVKLFATVYLGEARLPERIRKQPADRLRERPVVAFGHGRQRVAVHAPVDRQVIRHHRQAAGHGLAERDAPALLVARRKQQPGLTDLGEIRGRRQPSAFRPEHLDDPAEALARDLFQNRAFAGHAPHQAQPRPRAQALDLFPNRHDVEGALVGPHADHHGIDRGLRRRRQPADHREVDPVPHLADARGFHPLRQQAGGDLVARVGVQHPRLVRVPRDLPEAPRLHAPGDLVHQAAARALGRRALAVVDPRDPARPRAPPLHQQRRHDVAEIVADRDRHVRLGQAARPQAGGGRGDRVGPEAEGLEGLLAQKQRSRQAHGGQRAAHPAQHRLATGGRHQHLLQPGQPLAPARGDRLKADRRAGDRTRLQPAPVEDPRHPHGRGSCCQPSRATGACLRPSSLRSVPTP
jgi:hydrogenase-4 component B